MLLHSVLQNNENTYGLSFINKRDKYIASNHLINKNEKENFIYYLFIYF